MVASFSAEVRCMMFVFGDIETPSIESAQVIEELVRLEIKRVIADTSIVEPSISDILFALRSQKNLILRIVKFMHALDTGGRDKASKQDRVGEVLEAIGIWDFKKSIQRELKRYPSHDPLKLKKLQIMSDRINVLSAQEYEHHVYCQRASFYGYATQQRNNIFKTNDAIDSRNFPLKNQKMEKYGFVKRKVKVERFLDFLRGTDKAKIQLSDIVVEALICLANELVLLLVTNALKRKFYFTVDEQILDGGIQPRSIKAVHALLRDPASNKQLSLIKNSKQSGDQSIFLLANF